ncbi:unnamed protein product [Brachionus calyciflorus]|uniref:Uncharacterized protein n=1 Tax=Brachionus calyciflorus TaxID=104777 RepID=A0A814MGX2_9BILA|nr:unnamed protein product [Brachionus calyciflorus]
MTRNNHKIFICIPFFYCLQVVTSSICTYYPKYPDLAIKQTVECSGSCCTFFPVNSNDACCMDKSIWFLSIPILFIIILIILIVTRVVFLKYKTNSIRQEPNNHTTIMVRSQANNQEIFYDKYYQTNDLPPRYADLT